MALAALTSVLVYTAINTQRCVPGRQLSWSPQTGGCHCSAKGWKPLTCQPYPKELETP